MASRAEAWKQYKRDHPEYMERQKDLEKARRDARRLVAENHAAEYRRVYNRLKKERGL